MLSYKKKVCSYHKLTFIGPNSWIKQISKFKTIKIWKTLFITTNIFIISWNVYTNIVRRKTHVLKHKTWAYHKLNNTSKTCTTLANRTIHFKLFTILMRTNTENTCTEKLYAVFFLLFIFWTIPGQLTTLSLINTTLRHYPNTCNFVVQYPHF